MTTKNLIFISCLLLFGFLGGVITFYFKSSVVTLPAPATMANTHFCMNGPASAEMSLLHFSVEQEILDSKVTKQKVPIQFAAVVDEVVPRFPPMGELVLKLRKNLEEACQKASYPMLTAFEFGADIWAKPAFLKPQPWTYYSGPAEDYRFLGFVFEAREKFNTHSECLQQPLFRYGDRIVFYGYRKLSKDIEMSGRAAIVCGGQFDNLDHWESEDVH